ncbi:MAG: threonine--tRNA ligase [Candidatus Gracilibacteria bacterium]|nr:threonine--tRNA ligase [Candidatus Gracilibacteria bacterium]
MNVEVKRHSLAHILAQAVKELYPEVKLGTGPAIENGFYYDIDFGETVLHEDELKVIEKKMKNIIKQNQTFNQFSLEIHEAIELLKEEKENYKLAIINKLKEEGEIEISFYENINQKRERVFLDMCSGPHVEKMSEIDVNSFKLDKIAGAYFQGDSENKMLTRIYGLAFDSQEELNNHLVFLREAKKRDHRLIGKKLNLFSFHDEGPGFPFWHPKGSIMFNELVKFMQSENKARGYDEIKTPPVLNEELWHMSGHWANFKENMYFTEIDDQKFAIKPMNCPGGCLVFKTQQFSYRDLPIKNAEFGLVHRHELSGVLHGLFRVRSFTQDDAHIFIDNEGLPKQIEDTIKFVEDIYKVFGFEKINTFVATRPEKSLGSDEVWEIAQKSLEDGLKAAGLDDFKIKEGEGAFYGPKIEFNVEDSLGRNWQLGTIQVDFSMPERFGLFYTGKDGEKHTPVMIHRAIFGSLERFMGILIEHFNGSFPLWIAPEQVRIVPVMEKANSYAEKVKKELEEAGIRVEADLSDDGLNKKVRNAEKQRVNYILVVGEEEMANSTVSVRNYKTKDQSSNSIEEFKNNILEEVESRKI